MSDLPVILGGNPIIKDPVPLTRPTLPQLEAITPELETIFSGGIMTKGSKLLEFEQAIAAHLGVKHAIAVSSCTSGLMLTYQAFGLQGEVIVPSFTFMATVSALIWAKCQPVFADIDYATATVDPASVEELITPRTSAIVAVHNFGNPAQTEALQKLADQHGLRLIYDAAHGFGALRGGVPVGRQGHAQVYSLSPTKVLVAGEGGIVATNDSTLAEKIRLGREYGNNGHYDSLFPGLNARMPEFNALLGLHSLKQLETNVVNRNKSAALYRKHLQRVPGISFQKIDTGDRSSYKDFSIMIQASAFGLSRDELAEALRAENIDTRKYYTPAVHHQKAYAQYHRGNPLPNTDKLEATVLSLPIWSQMPDETVNQICASIQRIYRHAHAIHTTLQASPVFAPLAKTLVPAPS